MAGTIVRVEDAAGLTLEERRLLSEIGIKGSWREAARSLGIDPRRIQRMFNNDAFKKEYDSLFPHDTKVVERELNFVSKDAAVILEEVRDAELNKTVHAQCPQCGKKFDVFVRVIDYVTKMRALEIMLKTMGLMKDTKSVKVEGQVTHVNIKLSTAQMLAMQALDRGLPVNPQIYRELESLAATGAFELPPLPPPRGFVDAEFREVKEEDDETDTSGEQ